MRRLFWVAVGATGAVLVAGRLRRAARRYTPEGLAEQVDEAGRRASSSVREALDRFGSARREREAELVGTLLVTPEEGDPGAVFGRGRHSGGTGRRAAGATRAETDRADTTSPEATRGAPGTTARHAAGPPGRVDLDEPLNDF